MSKIKMQKKSEQSKELSDIEEMGVVQTVKDDTKIRSHITRLCNHRLMFKARGHGPERKKSSLLVTLDDWGEQEWEEQTREDYKKESKVVIGTFLQVPSQKQRVLEKLSSTALKEGQSPVRSHGLVSTVCGLVGGYCYCTVVVSFSFQYPKSPSVELKELTETESPPELEAPPSLRAAAPILISTMPLFKNTTDSFTSFPIEKESDMSDGGAEGEAYKDTCAEGDGIDRSRRVHADGEDGSVVSDGGRDDGGGLGEDESEEDVDSAEPCVNGVDPVLIEEGGVAEEKLQWYFGMVDQPRPNHVDFKDDFVSSRSVSSTHKQRDNPDFDKPSPSPSHSGTQRSLTSSVVSSALPSQVSLSSDPSPPVHNSSHSPQLSLSLSMSVGDLDAHLIQSASHSWHHPPHGFYSSMEVEIDPFAKEFRAGLMCDGDAAAPPLSNSTSCRKPSDHFFSSMPAPPSTYKKTIPKKAFQDQNFMEFIKTLGRKPEVQDYITYRMRVIGDHIEERYADKLNQAWDEVFFELVKENLSWKTFSKISRKLLLQGTRVQDGVMLIPTFARQLMEFVPNLNSTIGQYTEDVLDTYASDNILGMGGWVSQQITY